MNEKQKRARKRLKRKRERHYNRVTTPEQSTRETHATPVSAPEKSVSPRPHGFTIIGIAVAAGLSFLGICVTVLIAWWNSYAQPDIRYIPRTDSEELTELSSAVDSAGNFVHNLRVRPKFVNYGFKPGYIDKVEFVPLTVETLPDIKITSIGKSLLRRNEEKVVEITFIMTVPTNALKHLNTTRELNIKEVISAFDNTGKKVELLTNGLLGRIEMDFKQVVEIQAKKAPATKTHR